MKKLIGIGVALVLLAMVVLPLGAAAQPPDACPDVGYDYPATFAKVPFAILQSGLELIGTLMGTLAVPLGLPDWLTPDLFNTIGSWTGGPLSWTVDMLGWGVWLIGTVLSALPTDLGLPTWLPDVVNALACGLFTPFTCNVTGPDFTPCG